MNMIVKATEQRAVDCGPCEPSLLLLVDSVRKAGERITADCRKGKKSQQGMLPKR